MVTHKQIQTLRRIDEYGVKHVRAKELLVTGGEEGSVVLDVEGVYTLGDDSEVTEKFMLKLLERGLLKRDMRNITQYARELIEQADFELGED